MLSLNLIRTDGGTQPRAQIDMTVVAEYAADMGNGAAFPPVTVFYDGSVYWLADGFHRLEAAKTLGLAEIDADVRQGGLDAARWYSYGVNQSHGLRRTNDDKRRAVEAALGHPKAQTLTDVEIARHVGVSSMTVGNYRKTIIKTFNDSETRTVTRNGSTYTMNVAAIGQRVASPAIERVPFADDWGGASDDSYEYREEWEEPTHTFFPVVPTSEPLAPKPHVVHNSGNNEWYTPPEYIAAAVKVMGDIDLDPATSEAANEVVGAAKIYTAQDNGLLYQWRGRVWMNPPYAGELIGKFADKLVLHVTAGDVPAAIVLVNNATETGWFNTLMGVASAVVFPRGRVRFWQPGGDLGAPLQGQALIYIGPKPDTFLEAYKDFGWGAKLWR